MPLSLNYVFKRTGSAILVIIGVIVFSYLLLYLAPGDPAYIWAGRPRGPQASIAIENARRELGLDKPLPVQIALFTYRVFTGDMGVSIEYKKPVSEIIWRGLTASLELLIVAYIIGASIGILLGILSALKRGSKLDSTLQLAAITLTNAPSFWLAIGFIVAIQVLTGFTQYARIDQRLAIETGFHPITGFYLLDSLIEGNIPVFIDVLVKILPPALVVATYPLGLGIRMTRALMSDVLQEEYIRAAIAWGVRRRYVIWRYGFRGTTPGLVQVIGLAFAYSLIDAMIVEIVFGREGLGTLAYHIIGKSDFPLIIGLMITVTSFYIVVNTLTDIIQALIDPRVRI